MDPIGIFGGTFDPVHYGHLRLAEEACEKLGLEGVIWSPAGHTSHRNQPEAEAKHRLAMVELAIEDNDAFRLDRHEAESNEPSYTVPMLERVRDEYGDVPLVLLLGTDAFLGLTQWHRWEALFELAHIAVFTRPGVEFSIDAMAPSLGKQFSQRAAADPSCLGQAPAGSIVPSLLTPLDISATNIRVQLAHGGSPRYLLPDAVLDYIQTNTLYR
ncbi:MAG TPA: nicotinate-nucleotide adenylyltransferase [Rhodocyclaceae bacterium]|nr:nicotinate-nucleotide adenylyltransferase [Rhodocyclaceae bacterium]